MAEMVDTPTKSFQVSAALGKFLRVKLDGSYKLALAGAHDKAIGVTRDETFAADDWVSVYLTSKEGTVKIVADGAITREAIVYGAASGQVTGTANGNPVGRSHTDAGAASDVIEVELLETVGAQGEIHKTQVAVTDTATLTVAQMRSGIVDGTPTAAATYTTPTAAQLVADIPDAAVGTSYEIYVNNKAAGADTITMAGGTGVTADGTLTVAQNVCRKFLVSFTNVTAASEAAILYGIE